VTAGTVRFTVTVGGAGAAVCSRPAVAVPASVSAHTDAGIASIA
jgi:hypothetical protein